MTTININLLPEELRAGSGGGSGGASSSEFDTQALVPIGIGLAVAVVLFLLPWAFRTFYLDSYQAELTEKEAEVQAEIDKYNTSLKDLQSQGERRESLRKQLNTLQNVAGVTASWGAILNELRTLTPGSLWFEDFKVDSLKSEITIKGGALDYGAVAYFQRNLEHSEYFAGPQLKRTEVQAKGTRAGYVAFELTTSVRLLPPKSQ